MIVFWGPWSSRWKLVYEDLWQDIPSWGNKENIFTLLFPIIQDPNISNIIRLEIIRKDSALDSYDWIEATKKQSLIKIVTLCARPSKVTTSIVNL